MTGRSRFGKMSTRVRMMARTDENANATTRTMIVMGRRRAIRISHMGATFLSPGFAEVAGMAAGRLAPRRPQVGLATHRGGQWHHPPRPAPTRLQRSRHQLPWPNQTDIAIAVVVRWPVQPTVRSECSPPACGLLRAWLRLPAPDLAR